MSVAREDLERKLARDSRTGTQNKASKTIHQKLKSTEGSVISQGTLSRTDGPAREADQHRRQQAYGRQTPETRERQKHETPKRKEHEAYERQKHQTNERQKYQVEKNQHSNTNEKRKTQGKILVNKSTANFLTGRAGPNLLGGSRRADQF